MNKRINEIWESAGGSYTRGNQHEWPACKIDNFEKFAELLIKETLEVARAGIEYGDSMESAVYAYFGLGMTTEDKKTIV